MKHFMFLSVGAIALMLMFCWAGINLYAAYIMTACFICAVMAFGEIND